VTAPTRPRLDAATVVAAAGRIADAEGLEAVTLARVAAELGVRPPSLYNHVDGLAGLRRAMARAAVDELAAAIRDAAVGRARADALRAVAVAIREFARAHPGRYPLTVRAPPPGDEAGRAAAARAIEPLLAVLAGWAIEGDAAIHLVRVLRSCVHGFVSLETAGGFGLPLDVDRSFELLIEALVAAMEAAAGRPGAAGR
jgi:AcrR family transcriptional regulator